MASKLLRFDPTTPDGLPSLSVSFRRMLPTGVTVVSVTSACAVHPLSAVVDSNASSRLRDLPVVQSDGQTVSQFFSGGIAGVDYIISFLATYTDGEQERVDVVLPVRAYNYVGT